MRTRIGRGPVGRARATGVALLAAAGLSGAVLGACSTTTPTTSSTTPASTAPGCGGVCALQRSADALVRMPAGPPGIVIEVQRGRTVHTVVAGAADTATRAVPAAGDQMRVASVAKAWSGAVALSLVSRHVLSLDDTVGRWLPGLPAAWHAITLRQLLQHTSHLPDFSAQPSFLDAVRADPLQAPPPVQLLDPVLQLPLLTLPSPGYHYSNSDNVVVGLMVEAATHQSYGTELADLVDTPLGLTRTSLPADATVPAPTLHGYSLTAGQPPEDVTEVLAAGWAWASGGVVSTPAELNTFVRGYVSGRLVSPAVHRAQFTFVPGGGSEPPGPGTNAAGLALFRYAMSCGTMYGHTGNTLGYTQFAAASASGTDSVTVSVNAQITPKTDAGTFAALRALEQRAACLSLGH